MNTCGSVIYCQIYTAHFPTYWVRSTGPRGTHCCYFNRLLITRGLDPLMQRRMTRVSFLF